MQNNNPSDKCKRSDNEKDGEYIKPKCSKLDGELDSNINAIITKLDSLSQQEFNTTFEKIIEQLPLQGDLIYLGRIITKTGPELTESMTVETPIISQLPEIKKKIKDISNSANNITCIPDVMETTAKLKKTQIKMAPIVLRYIIRTQNLDDNSKTTLKNLYSEFVKSTTYRFELAMFSCKEATTGGKLKKYISKYKRTFKPRRRVRKNRRSRKHRR